MRTGKILLLHADPDTAQVLARLMAHAWPQAEITVEKSAVAFAEALPRPWDIAVVQHPLAWDKTPAIVSALARHQPAALIAVVGQAISPLLVQILIKSGARLCLDLSMPSLKRLADEVQTLRRPEDVSQQPPAHQADPLEPTEMPTPQGQPLQGSDPLQDVMRAALRSTVRLDRSSTADKLHATARAARGLGQLDKELQALETLLAMEPPDVAAGEQLLLLYERERPQEAARVLQRLAEATQVPSALRERYKQLVALQLESLHDAEAALATWTTWRRRDPDNQELTRILRDTLLRLRRWPDLSALLTELIAETTDQLHKQELLQELAQLQASQSLDTVLPGKTERPTATVHTLRPRTQEAKPQAKQEVQQLSEDTQEKLAVVVHDLQEPLRSVDSYLQVLQSRYGAQLTKDAVDLLEKARGAAQRMQGRVQGLHSQHQRQTEDGDERADEQEPAPQVADAKAILHRTLHDLGSAIARNQATVRAADLPSVAMDPAELSQVFENLVINALKYRSDDAPFIHVDAVREGDFWRFRIADNGLGIARSDHVRIFRLGERAHKSLPGTGLGLATCARIVERRGGRIWVESELGHGEAYLYTIPAGETGQIAKSKGVF